MSRPARHGHHRRRPTSVLPPEKGEPAADPLDGLLLAAGGGDLSAFAAFYDRTAPAVWGLLRGALDDSADAERAAQRVYAHLWRNAPSFDPFGVPAHSLLMSVARRELVGPIRDLVGRLRNPALSGDAPMADG